MQESYRRRRDELLNFKSERCFAGLCIDLDQSRESNYNYHLYCDRPLNKDSIIQRALEGSNLLGALTLCTIGKLSAASIFASIGVCLTFNFASAQYAPGFERGFPPPGGAPVDVPVQLAQGYNCRDPSTGRLTFCGAAPSRPTPTLRDDKPGNQPSPPSPPPSTPPANITTTPPVQVAPTNSIGKVNIRRAWYGQNCGVPDYGVYIDLRAACDDQHARTPGFCVYTIDHRRIGDPKVGCKKRYHYIFSCRYASGESSPVSQIVAEEASGKTIQISCRM